MLGAAASQQRHPEQAVRIRPAGWTAVVVAEGIPEFEARVVEISVHSIRLIAPMELKRGSALAVRIAHPALHDTFQGSALVAQAVAPPPVADTWVIAADFVHLSHEEEMRLGRWSLWT